MESGFSVSSKKLELASQSRITGRETSVFSETLSNVTSVTSDEEKHKRNYLEEEGYQTLKNIADEENVKVITANSSKTGDIVTIKIMSKAGNSGFCRKKGFHQEIEMMRQLSHPNLIKFLRGIETIKRYYIVMECAQNGSLSDLIRNEKFLTETKARNIYRQLASVLSYCNARGCIHHDIQSKTILFGADNVLKISIFGYSYRSMINHCVVVDTDCESSSLTESDYADIFGSGIVLFEMVYGKLPKGYNCVSLKHSLKQVHFPEQPDVTSMCRALISRILVSKNDNRISWSDITDTDWMIKEDMPKVSD